MGWIPKFGHLQHLGYCSSFESQIHEHVGVEGQKNFGIFCIRDYRSPENTKKRRMGAIKSGLQWPGKQQQPKPLGYWGVFEASMGVLIVQHLVLIEYPVPAECYWNSGHLESGCLLGFKFQEKVFLPRCLRVYVSLLGWVTPSPSPAALGAPGNGRIQHFQV